MRLFLRESEFIREAAYQSFLEYCNLWYTVAHLYMDSDEEMDCPEAQRAYDRAMSQQKLADFLDPQGRYNFYTRYRDERNNRVD
ncbi:hypothetical protein [Brasilonema sp. UFV-L1]|uniref:hypothetical protein n=1 Tax=Brasilonema sp. UFV-L1 TaxID=2234130 RepID=UPI00145DDE5F|nr:hypothetical protein [Brasilonema sp. UFV-L1]NMG11938.1 hypothetical protein [Brasilonema sp. UFV-L1]